MDRESTLLMAAGAIYLTPDDLESRLQVEEIPHAPDDLEAPEAGTASEELDALEHDSPALTTYLWSDAYDSGEAFVWRDVWPWSPSYLFGSADLWDPRGRWISSYDEDSEIWEPEE